MHKWYENAFIYQIYPRSFCDSNGDGIGDIPGITSKLNYLAGLGVDALWISPIFVSPMDDCGYDISDFRAIAPEYGTMEDFKKLLSEAHAKGIKILLDLVVNHTSTEHAWFKEAVRNPESRYHDYYFFRKREELTDSSSPEGSGYGEQIWEYVPENDEYYLRLGYKTQADLNWDNPAVRDEICDMINFWLDMGVDGFRCDVIYLISKEKTLTKFGMGPRLHEYLHELYLRCFEPHDAITVAEVWEQTPETTLTMIGRDRGELTMAFYFNHIGLGREGRFIKRPFRSEDFVAALDLWQRGINGKAQNTLVLENHDQSRVVSRFGNTERFRHESATMLATLTFMMQGCSFIYEGQELGLYNPTFDDLSEIKDVETLDYIADMRSRGDMTEEELVSRVNFGTRDAARVPMPWDESRYYGFSTVRPWLWGRCDYLPLCAAREEKDEKSTLSFFKKLIKTKKESKALSYGDFKLLDNRDGYFRYERISGKEKVTVSGNFSEKEISLPPEAVRGEIILCNYEREDESKLRPYEVIVSQMHD